MDTNMDISSIGFSIWNYRDILKASVVEVTESRCMCNGNPVPNGPRDSRFGCIDDGSCALCGQNRHGCPGHWGHIMLQLPVIHIAMVAPLLKILRLHCPCGEQSKKKVCQCGKIKDKYTWNKKNLCMLKNGEVCHTTEMPDCAERFLIKVLPVPPIHIRPPLTIGNTTRGENDLTYRIINIVRKNNSLKEAIEKKLPKHVIYERFEGLQHIVACYIDSDKVGSSRRNNSRREYTSLAGRIKGKEGTMRGHCMGKRVDQSGRCVITGDNRLKLSEIGIPTSIAKTLTKPIKVTDHNIAALRKALEQGKIRYALLPSGARIDTNINKPKIRVGWTLEQSLQDGDLVLFNRQPSLHKMSIMCHKVKVLPHNTLRFNAACTTPYNADFDGDEMNIHVPQTIEAQAEAAEIMAVKYQIVSPQANRPVIGVIQDTMLGAYLLSGETLSKADAFQVTQRPIEPPYTGLRILSIIMPEVWYSGCVEIEAGQILSGRFRKKDLGCSSGSLIHVIFNDCGPQATIDFIWEMEQFTSRFLHIRGYTVGLNDLRRSDALEDLCKEEMKQAFKDVQGMPEMETNQRLNQTRDILGSAAMAEISKDNQFYTMIYAGSKGSRVNITQIQGCIGQQNVLGSRIKKDWTNRTMTCYPHGCNSPESRGFVQHSYLDGLTPQEMYICAMAGREGLIDTAIKTAQTGYVERRLMKCMENIVAHADGSARDGDTMLQFKYGDDGLDAMHIEDSEWGPLPVPLQRMAKQAGVTLLPGGPTGGPTGGPMEHTDKIGSWIARAPPEIKQDAMDRLEKARVAEGECVGAIAAQSIGERATQCTLNSVDYNEWLVIENVDTCAGEFIDTLCDDNGPETQYIPVKSRKALTMDKHGNVSWNKLIAVTRHPPGPMLKVTTQSGRTMTCTVSKSFLTLQKGLWVPTSGDQLNIGMKVPLIAHVPDIYKRDNFCGKMVANFMAYGNVTETGLTLHAAHTGHLHNKIKYIVHGDDIVILDRALILAFMNFGEIPLCLIGCSNKVAQDFTDTYIALRGQTHKGTHIVHCKKTHRDILGLLLSKLGRHSVMTENTIVIPECECCTDTREDTIVNIEEHTSTHKYVYDLTVDKTKNMVLLNGIAIRDTFHFAGVSSKNVTLGLPRLEEVLNLSKKIKTPLNTFKQNQRARDIVQKIKYTELETGPVHMEDDMDNFWDFPDQGEYKGEAVRIEAEGDPIPIVNTLKQHGFDVAYAENAENTDTVVYHVYGEGKIPESIGVEGADWCKCTGDVVETTLGVHKLMEILPEELAKTVYSNDIHTMYRVFGIEAARVTILKEIRKILAHYGIDLNVRHLLVLVDWMTQTGKLTPMTRHGLKKVESDIIKRATFEEVVGVFINAAIHERKDPVDSISACILTGKNARIGTNTVHTVNQEPQEEDLFGEWNGWAQQDKPEWLQSPASPPVSPYAPVSPNYAPVSPNYAPVSPNYAPD